MPKLSEKRLKEKIKVLQNLKEHDKKIIVQLLKEYKFKDDKIAWYKKKLRLV